MEYKSFQFQSGAGGGGGFCKRLCLSSHFNPLKRKKKTLTSQILPQTFNVLEVLLESLL